MNLVSNLDLLSVGITVAAIAILGFILFINNHRSVTNRCFLLFSILTILYGAANFASYQVHTPWIGLMLVRLTVFFAVWHAFSFFELFYVFPADDFKFSWRHEFLLWPLVLFTSILTLTPVVLQDIGTLSPEGRVLTIVNGPGIPVFGLVVVGLVLGGVITLFRKMRRAIEAEKRPYRIIFLGVFVTFALLITFNFIFPALLDDSRFIAFGAVFMLPFILCTFYAINKHKLLNVKFVATQLLTFILAVVTFSEVILSDNLGVIVFRSGVFLLVLSFGILLIRSVHREIQQREKLELLTKELGESNTKLKELDKLKSEFLSFASHQVKAPMAVVKGYASLIFDGTLGLVPDKVKETTAKIQETADRLIALVNNLLNIQKIEEGKLDLVFEPTDINKMATDVLGELKTLADKKHLTLTFETLLPSAILSVDPQKFRQVVQNIIENSIKYTETGWIKVQVAGIDQGGLRLSITDSGRGMPPELVGELFEQYKRDKSAAKHIEGTGLGLYISKQIVLGHHGKIWAESAGPGKGSQFYVEIPSQQEKTAFE